MYKDNRHYKKIFSNKLILALLAHWHRISFDEISHAVLFEKKSNGHNVTHILENSWILVQGVIYWGIPSSDGIPYGLADFFFVCVFFFSPSAAENGIPGGQTHGRKPWIDLIF